MTTEGPGAARDRGPIAFMAGNSVAANLVMAFCLVGGFIALRNVGLVSSSLSPSTPRSARR